MKKKLKENIMSLMGVPDDVAYDLPTITVTGNNRIEVDNYKNIVTYAADYLKLNTTCGLVTITGRDIFINEMEFGRICVSGYIRSIVFDSVS